MTGRRLIEIGHLLYGKRGWQSRLAAALHRDASTIRRWVQANHVPPTAAMAVEHLLTIKHRVNER